MKRMWEWEHGGESVRLLIGGGQLCTEMEMDCGKSKSMVMPTADQWQEIIDAAAIERDKAQEREERKAGE